MTQEQKAWALALAFLEDVNADTVGYAPRQQPHGGCGVVQAGSLDPIPGNREMENASYHQVTDSGAVQNDSPSQYRTYKEMAAKAHRGLA